MRLLNRPQEEFFEKLKAERVLDGTHFELFQAEAPNHFGYWIARACERISEQSWIVWHVKQGALRTGSVQVDPSWVRRKNWSFTVLDECVRNWIFPVANDATGRLIVAKAMLPAQMPKELDSETPVLVVPTPREIKVLAAQYEVIARGR